MTIRQNNDLNDQEIVFEIILSVTAAIPVTRFGGKVLAHSANSIAVAYQKALLMIESNLI